MMDMVLSHKLTSGNSWCEESPPDGYRSGSTGAFGADHAARTISIKINFLDLAEAIAYLVGYSSCISTITNLPFDPTNDITQAPYYLNRKTPARHPAWPNWRCTKILSFQGRGLRNSSGIATPARPNPAAGAQPAVTTAGTRTGSVTGASSAAPIVITSVAHGLATGDTVTVTGVLGNTAANGVFTIIVLTADTFSLTGSIYTNAYTSGGTWISTNDAVQVGVYGQYELAYLLLQFEIPIYPIIEDAAMQGATGSISSVSYTLLTTPPNQIFITTAAPHGLSGGSVKIAGVVGTTAANGTWPITVLGDTTFQLNGAIWNSSYISGGTWTQIYPEYMRNCEFSSEVSLETQARKGQTWYFCNPNQGVNGLGQTTFPGDRLLRQPKSTIKVLWHDVHMDFVLLGRLVASNYEHRLGSVNSRAFPLNFWLNQNLNPTLGVMAQRVPGVCLLLAPRIVPHSQCHPAVLAGEIGDNYFPRTLDVETTILVFDPPSNEITTIDLSGLDDYGFPYNGSSSQLLRGHQLVPLVIPILDNGTPPRWWRWYASSTKPVTTANVVTALIASATLANDQITWLNNAALVSLVSLINTGTATETALLAAATLYSSTLPIPSGGPFGGFPIPADFVLAQVRLAITAAVIALPLSSDYQLLYPYSDFEQLWMAPENLTSNLLGP